MVLSYYFSQPREELEQREWAGCLVSQELESSTVHWNVAFVLLPNIYSGNEDVPVSGPRKKYH